MKKQVLLYDGYNNNKPYKILTDESGLISLSYNGHTTTSSSSLLYDITSMDKNIHTSICKYLNKHKNGTAPPQKEDISWCLSWLTK